MVNDTVSALSAFGTNILPQHRMSIRRASVGGRGEYRAVLYFVIDSSVNLKMFPKGY